MMNLVENTEDTHQELPVSRDQKHVAEDTTCPYQ